MAIAEDASSPAVKTATGTAATLTTASFTPPAGSLLVAMAAGGWNGGSGTPTVTVTDNVSGTWTLSANDGGAHSGRAVVYTRAIVSSAAMTVTANFTFGTGGGGEYLLVKVLTGANTTTFGNTAGARSATGTTYNLAITTTQAGSRVYGMVDASDSNDALTASTNTTFLSLFNDSTDVITEVAVKSSADTVTPGSLTMSITGGFRSDAVQYALLEVLPASVFIAPPPLVVQQTAFMTATY